MSRVRRLLLPCLCLLALNGRADEEEQHRSQLDALKEKIGELKETLFTRSGEVENLQDKLQARETAAGELRRKSETLSAEIAALEAELERLESRRDELEHHRGAQQEMIAREMDAAYRLGSSEPVKVLLNQEDPQRLARILRYYQYFATARQDKIHQFQKTLAELDAIGSEIAGKQEALVEARDENAIRLAELTLEMEKRQQVITELNKVLEDDKLQLAKLTDERARLQELIARLEEEINDLAGPGDAPFASLRGKLPWPAAGKLQYAFGNNRGQGLKWTGWLIDTDVGAPVHAIHNGRIVFSDYFRGHGLMIIVDHGDGFLSLYAHNQVLTKEVGDWVLAGDAIAQAGTTGGLAESALYFEIRHNGKPQDPQRWLASQG